ncbi:hypothetical protein PG987_003105 [Apiospora arundinis]
MLLGFDSIHRILVYRGAHHAAFPNDVGMSNIHTVWDGPVDLYSHVFEYQACVICLLSSAQLTRAWQYVASWNDWETKASHIAGLSEDLRSAQTSRKQDRPNGLEPSSYSRYTTLNKRATSVVYYFFKDGDKRHEHSYNALSAILHQLFVRYLTGKFTSHALSRQKNHGP